MRHRKPRLLPPREIDWEMNSVDSAKTSMTSLEDGRVELVIDHAVLTDVTPTMLAWWFRTASEEMEWKGRIIPRYHLWHPVDHISLEVVHRSPDGSVGPGSRFHIIEAFGGNLDSLIDQVVDVARLDESGLTLEQRRFGTVVMRLTHTFSVVPGGTQYHTRMLLGAERGLLMKPLSHMIRDRIFSPQRRRAWIKHNIEEVGNLPHFLPDLYASKR